MTKKLVLAGAAGACAAGALLVPGLSSGHTTISALQPQGPSLTAARTTYAVRSPNETPKQNTWRIVMHVPAEVQTAISVRHDSNWSTKFTKVPTGQSDEEGNPLYAITTITWTARRKIDEITPSEYGEWPVRFQNPATPAKLCFGFDQYYRGTDGSRKKAEVVNWTGPAGSEHPASCVDVVAQP